MNELVTILLATYNGEKYISHQVDSIISQTYTNWHLFIRDDVSEDNTPAIIDKYKSDYPGKIEVLENNGKNLGSLLNFGALLNAAGTAKYVMFCDQDDEWKKDKIELTLSKMQELEKQHGSNYPVLVFTNFQYVDDDMNIIESKKDFEINRLKNFGFSQLLAANPVYGCTMMINKALTGKVGAIPTQADFHDHWIALVAAAFGRLYYLKEKTVLYRQHGSNVSGNWDNDSFTKRFRRILINRKNFKEAKFKYIMLLAFKTMYYDALNDSQKKALDNFLSLFTNKNPLHFFRSIRNGIRAQTIPQSLLLYTTIFFSKPSSQL